MFGPKPPVDPTAPNYVRLVFSFNTTDRLNDEDMIQISEDFLESVRKLPASTKVQLEYFHGQEKNKEGRSFEETFGPAETANCYEELVYGTADVLDMFFEEAPDSAAEAVQKLNNNPRLFVEEVMACFTSTDDDMVN